MSKSIALIGFMASGKTTIGQSLAKKLNYTFVDTDALLVEKSGMEINYIFDKLGEDSFRSMETEILTETCQNPFSVLSTGGGIVMKRQNIEILQKNCFVVFLKVPFGILRSRAAQSDSRPLFRDPVKAQELYRLRSPLYQSAAHITVEPVKYPLSQVMREIQEQYQNFISGKKE